MTDMHTAQSTDKPFTTRRTDSWWVEPTLVAIGFGLFIIYSTFRAFEFNYFYTDPYLSPFYSPNLVEWFKLDWWRFSPAILILWIPAGFRATCYYYRKAYYRAYFLDPPACAVSHFGGHSYCGEQKFPLVIQNIHRYMLYLAILVIGVLWWDTFLAFSKGGKLFIGLGSIVFLINVVLLSNYTFGCHAWRHIVGGKLDCFSCSSMNQMRHGIWKWVTKLNEHHMFWAWLSLFSVGFTDFYVRSVAAGWWKDPIFFQ